MRAAILKCLTSSLLEDFLAKLHDEGLAGTEWTQDEFDQLLVVCERARYGQLPAAWDADESSDAGGDESSDAGDDAPPLLALQDAPAAKSEGGSGRAGDTEEAIEAMGDDTALADDGVQAAVSVDG